MFSAWKSSFSICHKAGLVVLNLLNFCLSEKLLISPSNLSESLAGQSILGCWFFLFITLNILCHSLLDWSGSCRLSLGLLSFADLLWALFTHACFHNQSKMWAKRVLESPVSSTCRIFTLSSCIHGWSAISLLLFPDMSEWSRSIVSDSLQPHGL